jgi:oligosaccharide translocation protein RFT1
MTMQSLFKHVLTEGDKFLVSRISALEDQGGYALASNYGAMVYISHLSVSPADYAV